MNIGIITFHRAINYGAILQTWALNRFLRKHEINVYIIDYRCSNIEDAYALMAISYLKNKSLKSKMEYLLSHAVRYKDIRSRNRLFERFINEEFQLLPIQDINKLDIVVAGSDQIWNPYLTKGLDKFYTLEDSIFNSVKRLAYAISGEPSYFSTSTLIKIGNITKSFSAVSVREENLKSLFEKYSDKEIEVCVDPTLLLESEDWDSLHCKRLIKDKYLFVYQVVHTSLTMKIAKKIARKRNLKIIYLNSKFSIRWRERNIAENVGPSEFVSLIKYADFVVTTSFHGAVLSVIMKKQFLVIKVGKMNRQKELLDSLGLEKRIVIDDKKLGDIPPIDYTTVNIETMTKSSKTFLIENCHAQTIKEY